MKENRKFSTYRIVFLAVMAAVVCVVTFFRFPLLGSKVHLANAMCLLSGMLFGPIGGGIAAGLGSALYDVLFGGYAAIEALVTFVSKFLMAAVCALLIGSKKDQHLRVALASIAGAATYVALYMLKTFVKEHFIKNIALDATWVVMGTKLPASLINAVVGVIVSCVLFYAIRPALRKAGLLEKLSK